MIDVQSVFLLFKLQSHVCCSSSHILFFFIGLSQFSLLSPFMQSLKPENLLEIKGLGSTAKIYLYSNFLRMLLNHPKFFLTIKILKEDDVQICPQLDVCVKQVNNLLKITEFKTMNNLLINQLI